MRLPWKHIESISQIVLVVQQIGGDMTKQTQEPNVVLFNLPMSGGQWIQIKGRAVSTPKVDGTDRNLLLRGAVSGLYRSYIIVYQFNSVYTSHIFRTCPIL